MRKRKKAKKEVVKKAVKVSKFILYYFLIFLALVIIFGTNWALDKAQINNFEQILLTLTNSVSTASNDMIISFIKDCILISLILTIIIFLIAKLFNNIEVFIKIKIKRKIIKVNLYKIISFLFIVSLIIYSTYHVTSSLYIYDYIKYNNIESNFFETLYVNPKNVDFDADKAAIIRVAYDLVKTEYYREENLNFENVAVDKLFNAYNDLISSISDYRFNAHSKNSYGGNQNRSNKEILLEISMLYPVLLDTLEKVDGYIVDNSDAFRLFVAELLDKIDFWTNAIKIANKNLSLAKFYYYGGSSTNLDLGISKKEWKLKRNEACHTIYEFYQDIIMINKAVDYESFDVDGINYSLKVSEIEELYNYVMGNIATGPNYYCYLSGLEREEDRNVNVLKKAIKM